MNSLIYWQFFNPVTNSCLNTKGMSEYIYLPFSSLLPDVVWIQNISEFSLIFFIPVTNSCLNTKGISELIYLLFVIPIPYSAENMKAWQTWIYLLFFFPVTNSCLNTRQDISDFFLLTECTIFSSLLPEDMSEYKIHVWIYLLICYFYMPVTRSCLNTKYMGEYHLKPSVLSSNKH